MDITYYHDDRKLTVHMTEVLDVSVTAEDPYGLHGFTSGTLQARGIGMWAFMDDLSIVSQGSPVRYIVKTPDPARSNGFAEQIDNQLKFQITWDEYGGAWNPKSLEDLEEAGRTEFLFLFVEWTYMRATGAEEWMPLHAYGLVLTPESDGKASRLGAFLLGGFSGDFIRLFDTVACRLGLNSGVELANKPQILDLGDTRLEDLVETATII